MEIANIPSAEEELVGGEIIRYMDKEPTGVFNENAMRLISKYVTKPDDKTKIEALNLAIEESLKNGITSFHDAGVDQETINLYESFLKNEMLSIRVYAILHGQDELINYWFDKGPSIGLGDDFLTVRPIKLYADGALESRGAFLHESYSDADSVYGHRIQTLEDILRISIKAYKSGFQVCTHYIGDKANKEVLDLYEIVMKSDTTKPNPRFRIEHA